MLDIALWTPEYFKQNEAECLEHLKDIRKWRKIPLLNHTALHNVKDGSLVRFRGMVQDMLDNEIYLEKYEVSSSGCPSRIQDGKFHDCLIVKPGETVNFDSPSNVHGERRTMFVISVPGINNWVEEFEQTATESRQEHAKVQQSGCGQKRPIEDDKTEMMDTTAPAESNKRVRTGDFEPTYLSGESHHLLSHEYLLNSPLKDRPSKACLIKIYSDFDNHRLNSIVDTAGFLSVDSVLDGTTEQLDDHENAKEFQAANPPPSLIPRIHVVAFNKLSHINPLLDPSLTELDTNYSRFFSDPIIFENIHKDLKTLLTHCLFGDALAAEYLISHLISTVYARSEIQALGQFTLNISNIPKEVLPEYTQSLYEIIEALVPASYYFPMTLENMNTFQFTPKKDYSTNKLISGVLQLAPHTHLILDETRLETGKLEANGVFGVQSLSYLIKMQQFRCNFEFYELDFDTNIPVLILSEGKSMLPSDCHIPLQPDQECITHIKETMKAAKHYLKRELTDIRRYLTAAKIHEFNVNASNSEMIQNDFVEMRRLDKSIGPEHLHSLLVLSRLLGISMGQNSLQKGEWLKAKEMEKDRKERIYKSNRK